jgi:hypothetical protein
MKCKAKPCPGEVGGKGAFFAKTSVYFILAWAVKDSLSKVFKLCIRISDSSVRIHSKS